MIFRINRILCKADDKRESPDPIQTNERWSPLKKTEAILKAIGVYLGLNALSFGGAYILGLVFTSPVGRWLELNKPTEPAVPGSFIILQFIPIMIAIEYYRNKVKSD